MLGQDQESTEELQKAVFDKLEVELILYVELVNYMNSTYRKHTQKLQDTNLRLVKRPASNEEDMPAVAKRTKASEKYVIIS